MSFREEGSGPTSPTHASSRRLQFSSEDVEAELAKIDSMIDVLKSQIQRSGSESPSESVCLWGTENAVQATELDPSNVALLSREGMRTRQKGRSDTGGVSKSFAEGGQLLGPQSHIGGVGADRAERARQADAAESQRVTYIYIYICIYIYIIIYGSRQCSL